MVFLPFDNGLDFDDVNLINQSIIKKKAGCCRLIYLRLVAALHKGSSARPVGCVEGLASQRSSF